MVSHLGVSSDRGCLGALFVTRANRDVPFRQHRLWPWVSRRWCGHSRPAQCLFNHGPFPALLGRRLWPVMTLHKPVQGFSSSGWDISFSSLLNKENAPSLWLCISPSPTLQLWLLIFGPSESSSVKPGNKHSYKLKSLLTSILALAAPL